MHDYLLANSGMTKKEKLFAFCVRSQMLEVKKNFKVGKSDLNCSLGCDTTEDQEQHLLWCPVLREDDDDLIDYKDIYSQDHLKVKEEVTRILMTKFYKFLRLKATVHGKSLQLNSSAAESDDIVDNDVNDNDYDDIVNFSDFELE